MSSPVSNYLIIHFLLNVSNNWKKTWQHNQIWIYFEFWIQDIPSLTNKRNSDHISAETTEFHIGSGSFSADDARHCLDGINIQRGVNDVLKTSVTSSPYIITSADVSPPLAAMDADSTITSVRSEDWEMFPDAASMKSVPVKVQYIYRALIHWNIPSSNVLASDPWVVDFQIRMPEHARSEFWEKYVSFTPTKSFSDIEQQF